MAAKIVSQRKFSKLVSSTGSLSQPPGALPRLSNLILTQRGSLQIANGSKSIGQLPSPFIAPRWIASFTKFASGSYPFYPTLAFPNGTALQDVSNFTITITPAGSNPAATYYIAIVARGMIGSVAIHSAPVVVTFVATHTFSVMNFSWSPVSGATGYDFYYLASADAVVGAPLLTNVSGVLIGAFLTDNYSGSFTVGTTPIPQSNTSFLLQLLIGSVAPPSPIVNFVLAGSPFPSTPPQPAQLAPGDPNFVFDTINTDIQTLFPSSSGGTANATANSGVPNDTLTVVVASGWAASATVAGQSISATMQVSGSITVATATFGGGAATYEYSPDSGATWVSIASFSTNGSTWNQTLTFSVSTSVLTDISHLQIRVTARAQWGFGPGNVNVIGSVVGGSVSVTTSTSSSFSPYGGIVGLACVIPTELQFAGKEILILGNGYPPQQCDPTGLGATVVTALTNTFTAAFPTWQAAVAWLTGSQVTDGAGNYFIATQGGVSQTPGPPAWNIVKGDQTVDGTVIWTSQGPIVATTAPRGAAHAVAYAGSLWLANTSPQDTSDGIDGPSCLKMSDSNNPNSWNPINTAFIGRNDGTQITGMQPFTIAALGISPTGSLCVFKEYTTYQVIGIFGSTTFEIQPAQTNLGCIAARSIQFLPGFGVVRFTHLGFAVFDGINDRLISEDIRPYLFGGVDSEADLVPVDPAFCYLSQSAQTIAPPMYLCAMPLAGTSGALTRLFCYDLVMKAWTVLDLPWAISSLGTLSIGEGYPLTVGGKTDGKVQRIQSGDVNWDAGATDESTVEWGFRTPDIFGEGSSQKLFFEQATIRGYGNAAMVQSILASFWLDGENLGALGADVVPQGGSSLFEVRFSIFRSGYRAHIDFAGNGGEASGVIDSVDWAVTPKSALARRIIG